MSYSYIYIYPYFVFIMLIEPVTMNQFLFTEGIGFHQSIIYFSFSYLLSVNESMN